MTLFFKITKQSYRIFLLPGRCSFPDRAAQDVPLEPRWTYLRQVRKRAPARQQKNAPQIRATYSNDGLRYLTKQQTLTHRNKVQITLLYVFRQA